MPDPGMMLRDLEEFRGPPHRPWLVVVIVVALATIGLILLLRRLEGPADASPETAPTPTEAATDPMNQGTPEPVAKDVPPGVLSRFDATLAMEAADRLPEARTNLLALLDRPEAEAIHPRIEERLGAINVKLVTTQRSMPEKIDYAVRAGDSLKLLAKRFGVTTLLIEQANSIPNPDRIHIGDRMRILDKPNFEILIDKKANDLLLTMKGRFFKRYRVGTGEFGRTPAGTFRIDDKILEPPWWRPDGKVVPFGDPENILGTRWMSLEATGRTPPAKGYGIHGTWDESTLGKQSSAGCVRMRNADVEELFLLVPRGTPVRIVE